VERETAGRDIGPRAVAAVKSGDRDAFTALVRHYDPRLRALAFHMLGDRHATDDVLQDVYLKAFRGLGGFDERAALGTWLCRIAYTTCLDELRRRRVVPVDDIETVIHSQRAPDGVGAHAADALIASESVAGALRLLPLVQRATVVLVAVAGLEYHEAADVLGVPPGTVASRMAGARRILRAALQREHGDASDAHDDERGER
jgi:RNA polymerase sigma-70 factor, ECF subfamily